MGNAHESLKVKKQTAVVIIVRLRTHSSPCDHELEVEERKTCDNINSKAMKRDG